MNRSLMVEMHNNQFPFGAITAQITEPDQTKKILVKKKVQYHNQKQKKLLDTKINILTKLYHRNIINVRHVEELPTQAYNIYYNYVPFALEQAFEQIGYQTFKELHRQIIHLAIHLAKNYILTSFNPNRCGVVFIGQQFIIKYYLPLNEIVITQNIAMLERSVQLFKVQATHILDNLCRHDLSDFRSTTSEQFSSLNILTDSKPRDSLEVRNRKLSNQFLRPHRRFSNTSSLKLLVNDVKRKESQDSTIFSQAKISGLKQTLKTLKQNTEKKRVLQRQKLELKTKIQLLRLKSSQALLIFELYKEKTQENKKLLKIVAQNQIRKTFN